MDTIKNSELAEYQETSVYVDRAIQYIITSDGLQDNLPSEFQEMMLYLYEIRDVYSIMARPEKMGDHARHIIMTILEGSASPKEAAQAFKYVEILDSAIEWIVTSDGLQENMPSDFDLIMQQLFNVKRLFQSVINSVRSLDINKIEYPVLMAAEPEPEYNVGIETEELLPLYSLQLHRSKDSKWGVNFLILSNWPQDLAKNELMNLLKQFDGLIRGYYDGDKLLELYSIEKFADQDVIFIESAGEQLIQKLVLDNTPGLMIVLTTDLTKDQLANIWSEYVGESIIEPKKVEICDPHRIKISLAN